MDGKILRLLVVSFSHGFHLTICGEVGREALGGFGQRDQEKFLVTVFQNELDGVVQDVFPSRSFSSTLHVWRG